MTRIWIVALLGFALAALALPGRSPALAAGSGVNQSIPEAVVVIKQYGAALHIAPASDADSLETASCGEVFPVIDAVQGWYEVVYDANGDTAWVGGARVGDANNPPIFDCTDATTFQPGDTVGTAVVNGCLSLRYSPSRDAGYDYCVGNGHLYTILNGPVDVNGEDWFDVTSASTGEGWVLAQYLYPTGN